MKLTLDGTLVCLAYGRHCVRFGGKLWWWRACLCSGERWCCRWFEVGRDWGSLVYGVPSSRLRFTPL